MYPRLFHYGPVTLPAYGAIASLAMIASLLVAMRTGRRLGLDPNAIWNLGLSAAFSGLIGAKILLVLENWSSFLEHPMWILSLSITRSHHLAAAAILCGAAAAGLTLVRQRMAVLPSLDALAPALAVGAALLSLGAFAAGSEYGRPTTLPWGVVFHDQYAAFSAGTPVGIPLHPTQLYQLAVDLVLCCILLWLTPRRTQDGEAIGAFLFLYGASLFLIQMVRGDADLVIAGIFSISQVLGLCMMAAGGLFWLPRDKRPAVVRRAS